MRWYKTVNDDCAVALRRLGEASVDLICCDPPYGIKFMGKDWDRAVPSIQVWKECLRVLKPGAFAFILCTPRQDCLARMIVNLEEAGFNTNFTSIYWVYSQGFPKAQNLGKQVDKKAGAARPVVGKYRPPNGQEWNLTQAAGLSDDHVGGTFTASKTRTLDITAPATEEAKRINGAYGGFQPKPSLEPVIVVMKPLAKRTYLDQALDNGKGCTWLDDGRIPADTPSDATQVGRVMHRGKREHDISGQKWGMNKSAADYPTVVHPAGRVPANVLVQDDALLGYGQTKSVKSTRDHAAYEGESNTKMLRGRSGPANQHGDAGSISRYFDLDAWWNKNIRDLPVSLQNIFPCVYVAKPPKKEKNFGLDNNVTNDHPTVKPLKLMSYLVTIGSRPRDVVLDPFMGSGTTGVAALQLRRRFLGVELDQHYHDIATQRLQHVEAQLVGNSPTGKSRG